ncbi:MAG: helix-turn-helix domain-containing protein [Chloroflexota bacterium]|nr:helix-turn-helix domain-containing protein [Chloroflexota bacterium]
MTDSIHKLGEVLRTARESKGVDVARVERDTKIRMRYLSALERGDYRDLPGAVYTKGFLRNYGLYLGLDPEYLIDLYRLETGAISPERVRTAPPRALATRRARALVLTPGAIFAAILTVGVFLFVGYLGYEFVTFARTPDLRVTEPAGNIASWGELTYLIRGTTEPSSRVTIDGLSSENPVVVADAEGNFQVEVRLVPGSNVISVVATDPATKRDSMKVTRTIIVGGGSSPTPTPTLVVSAPQDRATLTGPLTISGTASPSAKVAVTAKLATAASPAFSVKDFAGQAVSIRTPAVGAVISASATAATDGAFSTTMSLPAGDWDLTLVAGAPGASPAPSVASPAPSGSVTRRITVRPPVGLTGTIVVARSASYLLVLQDGVPLAGVSGHVIAAGRTIALSARSAITVRAGNAAAVSISIDGISLGTMGGSGEVIEWRIRRTA